MKCNKQCIFYIEDIDPCYNIIFGGPPHVMIPRCKLDAPIIVGSEYYVDEKLGICCDVPIIVGDCPIEEIRIQKIKELLGEK